MRIGPKASLLFFITVVLFALTSTLSCKKVKPLSAGGEVRFSDDTLKFDTIFTAAGSYTNWVTIHNPQSQEIVLSSVRLQNGSGSYFHLNVDGFQGNNIANIRIRPHDSVYVFATVKIDPNDTLTPFLVTDRLIATLNGKEFSIPFTAYGQNAHYIVSDSITKNTTWLTDKPYVVLHACVVGQGVILTIPGNCRVYMHQDARFFVYGGLAINPTGTDSVVIQGDRLDRAYFGYKGYPGEWGGIYFVPGGQGLIRNTIIKNCGGATPYYGYGIRPAAIQVDTLAKLWMDHTIVKNSIGYGILGLQGSVVASNCLVHTCGAQALAIIQGGNDTFTNCTFATYGTQALSHTTNPSVAILNYYPVGDGSIIPGNLNTVLTNCIVYGSLDSEFYCDAAGGGDSNLVLNNCLIGMGYRVPGFLKMNNCILGQAATGFIDPKFTMPDNENFDISAASPVVGKGLSIPWLTDDLAKRPRGGSNDMGCYQHQ